MVIGASAGGILALKEILGTLKSPLACSIVVVMHRLKNVESRLEELLQQSSKLPVKEAQDKETLVDNTIYLAPSNYHLLVERDQSISLSVSEKVNFSRPSIDVTFISVAEACGKNAVGIILTGANRDGASGLQLIAQNGGETLVQNLEEAHVDVMPQSALAITPGAKELKLEEIGSYINSKFAG